MIVPRFEILCVACTAKSYQSILCLDPLELAVAGVNQGMGIV